MKHLLSLFSLLLFVGVSQLSAQENQSPVAEKEVAKISCSKKCSKSCAAKAAKAAMTDETIEKKVCEKSGKVSYQRKDVCEKTGKISYTAVQYDEAQAKFVDIDESDIKASSMMKKGCSKSSKAGCCAKKASAQAQVKENVAPMSSEGEGTN